ncbi:MAG: YjbH domain-containing protein [Sulfitobacter sp.]|nr:YjbH domain-containing protein [Sulfitobacter sp.]
MDMPSAEMLPDGEVAVDISSFGGSTRTTLTFQATPRIQASFRYSGIKDATFSEFDTYRDRSFDVRFLLNRESKYLPALTVGLQDFAGTGIYAGEFVAATKNFSGGRIPGTVKATVGLG